MKFWAKVAGLVAGVWIIAAVVIHFARSSQPTAATVAAYVQSTDLDSLQGNARLRAIAKMENMMNRLAYDDRREADRDSRDFFKKLTPSEQGDYLDATLPTGFEQMMDAFNKMDPLKRKQMVADALARMKEHEGEGHVDPNPDVTQHIINQGLKSFYKDANADVKMDLAPLVEQMQRNLENP